LTPTPLDPTCEFKGTPGTVALTVVGVVGTAVFASASYDDVAITPMPSSTISFAIKTGNRNLDVVYAFSDPANGVAELREECANNTKLMVVRATDPAQRYRICA
jgi:hypothetical protein